MSLVSKIILGQISSNPRKSFCYLQDYLNYLHYAWSKKCRSPNPVCKFLDLMSTPTRYVLILWRTSNFRSIPQRGGWQIRRIQSVYAHILQFKFLSFMIFVPIAVIKCKQTENSLTCNKTHLLTTNIFVHRTKNRSILQPIWICLIRLDPSCYDHLIRHTKAKVVTECRFY